MKKKYKILVVCPTFAPHVNGLANVAVTYCLGLMDFGHTVEVATAGKGSYTHQGIQVHGFDLKGSFTFKNPIRGQLFKYFCFIKNSSYDLIICHALQTAIVDISFIASKSPILYFSHGVSWASPIMPGWFGWVRLINYLPYRVIGPWIIKKAKFAIFLGEKTINDRTFDSEFFPKESKMVVQNASNFNERSAKQYAGKTGLNLLVVGLCSPEKGFDRILALLPKLDAGCVKTLTICTFDSAPYLKYFRDQIAGMNLEYQVQFVFNKTGQELEVVYEEADLLLNLSYSECYPLIIADAQNMRLPAICFDTGYQREIPGICLVEDVNGASRFVNSFPSNAVQLSVLSSQTVPRMWSEAVSKLEDAVQLFFAK